MPYCQYHRNFYRRNMDESFRKEMRDQSQSRDEKLQRLLLYSQRSGIAIGDLDVYGWSPDEYTAKPNSMTGDYEIFRWRLSNNYVVSLTLTYSGEDVSKTSLVIQGPTLRCNALHHAIMHKYRNWISCPCPECLSLQRSWGLFATGSDLPPASQDDGPSAHEFLLPQKPFHLKQIIQIVLLEALAATC